MRNDPRRSPPLWQTGIGVTGYSLGNLLQTPPNTPPRFSKADDDENSPLLPSPIDLEPGQRKPPYEALSPAFVQQQYHPSSPTSLLAFPTTKLSK